MVFAYKSPMVYFTNTMTGKPEEFIPANPERVTMYVCGSTVYDVPHLGNARPAVIFDVLFRLLRRIYGNDAVVYASNYTDIDDKIVSRARQRGIEIATLTSETIAQYEEAMSALGVLHPTYRPIATQSIPAMQVMIAGLIEKGHAYEAGGHVYFSVKTHDGQGRLSGQKANDQRDGVRDTIDNSLKRDPADFVLWKPSKEDEPGWDSPWGFGRPGWHIECSTMIEQTLGTTIDIHGGGIDLIFPHHEAEIAQSECQHSAPLARYWLHNGMLTVDGRKMGKSYGNFITVPEALERHNGEVLRYLLLEGHYRQPIDFSWEKLDAAKAALTRLYRALETLSDVEATGGDHLVAGKLSNDLNTAEALASMHGLATIALSPLIDDLTTRSSLKSELLEGAHLLGLFNLSVDEWFGRSEDVEIADLVRKRDALRETREWVSADAVRDLLTERGITLEDGPNGTIWRR